MKLRDFKVWVVEAASAIMFVALVIWAVVHEVQFLMTQ